MQADPCADSAPPESCASNDAVVPGRRARKMGFARGDTSTAHRVDLREVLAILIVAGNGAAYGGPHRAFLNAVQPG